MLQAEEANCEKVLGWKQAWHVWGGAGRLWWLGSGPVWENWDVLTRKRERERKGEARSQQWESGTLD